MPNGSTHIIAGALVGGAASIVIQKKLHESEQVDLGHVLLASGSGALAGRIPDILEPASSPNHRALFHSLFFVCFLGFGIAELWKRMKRKRAERIEKGIEAISLMEVLLAVGAVALLAILLHLIMDGFTRKGLPLI